MRFLPLFSLLVILFILPVQVYPQQVVLNEIMASNSTTMPDEDGDYPDWIELYNAGSEPLNLAGFGLSDNWEQPFRWVFPEITLEPGGFLLVWASGKDRNNPHQPLHTNFSISAAGEEVLLTHPDGTLIDSHDPLPIPTDISYGRQPDGEDAWLFFTEPTPDAPNITQGYSTLLTTPEFSATSGFYADPFSLQLTSTDPGATIHYTLDGSKPGPDSPVYTVPLEMTSRQGDPNILSIIPTNNNPNPGPPYYEGWQPPDGEVKKANVVRAIALKEGALPSPVSTATYLVAPQGEQRYTLPVFSINTDMENFFDPDIGIYVPGHHNNYFQRGREWEREVHLEFFEPGGLPGFSQNIGVRIHGGTTRSRPRKSLRLYSRSDYGTSRITYQLFPDKPINDFNRLLLRNSGNDWDWTVFRDAFLQHLAKDMNVDIQFYRPAIVFVNGEYWGIHNMRDRYDQHYIETHYGIEEQDMVMLENNAHFDRGNPAGRQHYLDMLSYMNQHSMANNQHYQEVITRIDPWSFIDYQVAHIFAMNTDWPGNNALYWRYINDGYDPEAPPHLDGRWRWMLLDMDFGFGLPFFYVPGVDEGPAHNTLAFATEPNGPSWPNPPWSTFMLRRLLENTTFRNNFINRFADMLNTGFHQDHVNAVIDSIQGMLEPEMQEHIDRWRRPPTMSEWHDNINVMRNFANLRPGYMRQHIMDHFNLQGTATVNLTVNEPYMGRLQMNTVTVSPDPHWSGIYFTGVPVQVIARPNPGYRLKTWEGISALPSDTLQLMLTGDISITAVFEESGDFPGDEMNPVAHRLSLGDYVFNYWDHNEPAGNFPDHMVFQQSEMNDPRLEDEMTHPYHVPYLDYHHDDMGNLGFPYRLTRRTRINGLGADGISFINTGRERDLGAAVLALDTRGVFGVDVTWTGGTEIANSRAYAIRLQYRVGHEGGFADVTDVAGNPVEYMRSSTAGHEAVLGPVALPASTHNQPYVQLRWKYYYTGEQLSDEFGARDMLRLDDIRVQASGATGLNPSPPLLQQPVRVLQNHPNPFSTTTRIPFEIDSPTHVLITVHDQRGVEVKRLLDQNMESGRHTVDFHAGNLPAGIYFYRVYTLWSTHSKRMMLLK
jgi:hypothetical protein